MRAVHRVYGRGVCHSDMQCGRMRIWLGLLERSRVGGRWRDVSRGRILSAAALHPHVLLSPWRPVVPSLMGKSPCLCGWGRGMHVGVSVQSLRRGKYSSLEDFKQYVASLTPREQRNLQTALREVRMEEEEEEDVEQEVHIDKPSWRQLRLLCYQNALPFIGFGFLDNVIMITVGEYIDWTIGLALGLSTMAAAAIGNMISDLAGIGLADQVEALCRALGIPNPQLSSTQMKHQSVRWMGLLGRCLGIIIGCTIGMTPLLFLDDPHKSNEHTVIQSEK